MPKGMGIYTNPKKAIYNKVYNKTSISVDALAKKSTVKSKRTKKKELNYIEQKIEDKSYARNLSTKGKHVCEKCDSDNWAIMSQKVFFTTHEVLYCERCHKIGQTYKRDKGESIENFLQFLKEKAKKKISL